MQVFNLKVAIVVVGVLFAAIATVHTALYLSIDPGSLSAQMPFD